MLSKWVAASGWWDGRTESGILVPSGVYFYILEFVNEKDEIVKKSGNVTVLKD